MRRLVFAAASVALTLLFAQVVGLLSADTATLIAGVAIAAALFFPPLTSYLRAGEPVLPDWLDASPEAVRFVRRHGNVLYIWAEPLGGGLGTIHCATESPTRVEFEKRLRRPMRVRVERGLLIGRVRLRVLRWPEERLAIDAPKFNYSGAGVASWTN